MATAKKARKVPVPRRKPGVKKSIARKAGVKRAARSATTAGAQRETARPPAAPKADKPKKTKLVRDSFTIPKAEFAVLQDLKQRAGKAGMSAKKSELLRAGIMALAAMGDAAFAAAVAAVPPIKTGRPAKE